MLTFIEVSFWVVGFCLWAGLFKVALSPLLPLNRLVKQRRFANHQLLLTQNIQHFQQRFAELQQDFNAGRLNQQAYQQQKTQLQRQLIQLEQLIDVSTHVSTVSIQSSKQASKQTSKQALNQPDTATQKAIEFSEKQYIKKLVSALLLLSLILLVILYQRLSNRAEVHRFWQAQQQFAQNADDVLTAKTGKLPATITVADISAFLAVLQSNVHQNANDADRWLRLSEVLTGMQATDAALQAMARAYRLDVNNQAIAADYAQMRFFANGGQLDNTTRQVIEGILTQNPNHEGVQMLLIMGEIKAGDNAQSNSRKLNDSAKHYEVALDLIDGLRNHIISKSGNQTQALLSLQQLVVMIEDKQQVLARVDSIDVSIQITKEMLPFVKPTDVLFLILQDVKGDAPFAVKRVKVADINLSSGIVALQLTEQDVIMPSVTLSQLLNQQADSTHLALTARISHTGNMTSQSQDLIANPILLVNKQSIKLMINQKIP